MLREAVVSGVLTLGCLLQVDAALATSLPDNIESAHICTTFGKHGFNGSRQYVQLAGTVGSYDNQDPPRVNAFGQLSHIVYSYAESTIYGRWRANRQHGWFRWAFYDLTGFYGSWGYGNVVATNEQGYWNGELCAPTP